jgi:hypothetical protein
VPSHFVLHAPLTRVHHDLNLNQFNENTRSYPTNNRTRDLAFETVNHHILYQNHDTCFPTIPLHPLIHPTCIIIHSTPTHTTFMPCPTSYINTINTHHLHPFFPTTSSSNPIQFRLTFFFHIHTILLTKYHINPSLYLIKQYMSSMLVALLKLRCLLYPSRYSLKLHVYTV